MQGDREHDVGRPHCGGGYPYDRTFTDMARQETRPIAANAARWIEYPIAGLALDGSDWRPGFVIRPFLLGALGVGLVLAIRQLRRSRRPRATSQVATA